MTAARPPGPPTTWTEAQWAERLSPESFAVLRHAGTERPFTGAYWNTTARGIYACAGCDTVLFRSTAKFDAGCGWPSFFEPVAQGALVERVDTTHGMRRTEVVCGSCNGHLGHVFDDGPPPTGLRYCMNSASLRFTAD